MWYKIFFNAQSIQSETDRSVLIKMPNKSQFKDYVFWHPIKCVMTQGGKGYHKTFSFTDDWLFTLKLYGKGKSNRFDVIKKVELTADEMMQAFGVVDENVNEFVVAEALKIIDKETIIKNIEHHIPNKLDKSNIEHNNSLMK